MTRYYEPRPCRLTGAQFKAHLNHPAIDRCENDEEGGLDAGRYFVHLLPDWNIDAGNGRQLTFSCSNLREARQMLRWVSPYKEL